MTEPISKDQLRRLQTLYSAYARRELCGTTAREARIAWASTACGRQVASFTELQRSEANSLIDTLQTALGQAFEPADRKKRRVRDRDAAAAAGTEGRRGSATAATLASADDLARVESAFVRVGWDRARFDAWLRSPSSPLRGRSNPQVRTQGDANRVWWALKRMIKRAGAWNAARQSPPEKGRNVAG